jgi:hypothetical protein
MLMTAATAEYGSGYNAPQGTQAPATAEAAYLHEQQAGGGYNTGGATTSEAAGTGFGPTPGICVSNYFSNEQR